MKNKGHITVFLCLMIVVIMTLATTCLYVSSLYIAKGQASMEVKSAVSDIKAGYNSYIFEHYHILLFDKTANQKGEAYLEEECKENILFNLGKGYLVNEISISEFQMLTDDDLKAFKSQIEDYLKYALVEDGMDRVITSVDGKDGTLPADIQNDLDTAEAQAYNEPKKETEASTNEIKKEDDPRDFTKSMTEYDLMAYTTSNDKTYKETCIDRTDLPSMNHVSNYRQMKDSDRNFSNKTTLRSELASNGPWIDDVKSAGESVYYAKLVFNSAVDNQKNTESVHECEMEYIVCGKDTDSINLHGAIKKIVALRTPINYAYLLSSPTKVSQILAVATPISAATLIHVSVLKHLIAGCWAYCESIAETNNLLKGKKIAYKKSEMNWITDLDNLGKTVENECVSDENGLDYEDYLLILMTMNMKTSYYRMLDIMQINVRQNNENFFIKNASVGMTVDAKISYGDKEFDIRCSGGY